MLDKDTLEAIGQMLDNKLDAKLDEKLAVHPVRPDITARQQNPLKTGL